MSEKSERKTSETILLEAGAEVLDVIREMVPDTNQLSVKIRKMDNVGRTTAGFVTDGWMAGEDAVDFLTSVEEELARLWGPGKYKVIISYPEWKRTRQCIYTISGSTDQLPAPNGAGPKGPTQTGNPGSDITREALKILKDRGPSSIETLMTMRMYQQLLKDMRNEEQNPAARKELDELRNELGTIRELIAEGMKAPAQKSILEQFIEALPIIGATLKPYAELVMGNVSKGQEERAELQRRFEAQQKEVRDQLDQLRQQREKDFEKRYNDAIEKLEKLQAKKNPEPDDEKSSGFAGLLERGLEVLDKHAPALFDALKAQKNGAAALPAPAGDNGAEHANGNTAPRKLTRDEVFEIFADVLPSYDNNFEQLRDAYADGLVRLSDLQDEILHKLFPDLPPADQVHNPNEFPAMRDGGAGGGEVS